MTDQTVGAHLPAILAGEWSLSHRDKKRLKNILLLSVATILLLWFLYQLAQYTVSVGANQQITLHIDGDWKRTIHTDSSRNLKSPSEDIGAEKGIPGKPRALSPAARAPADAPLGDERNEAAPGTLVNDSDRSIFPSTVGTETEQQENSGFDSRNSPFLGYGNPSMPWVINDGGSGSSLPREGGSGGRAGDNGKDAGSGSNQPGSASPDTTTGPGEGPRDDNAGSDPNGAPAVFPNFDDPPQFDNAGYPSGDGGSWLGPPTVDSTSGAGGDGATVLAPTIQVPEPDSIALFAVGLIALLTVLRVHCSRRHDRLQASRKGRIGIYLYASFVSAARRAAGLHMRRNCLAAFMGIALLAFIADTATAETATVYGTTASIFSANSGAFLPANTKLACFSMNEADCWDGKSWHHLYPSGRRHYAAATTDRVACSVIVAPRNDCWTGSVWYRLPRGQIFGVIGGFFSNTPGAFITAPLRSPPVTYISAPLQSPLGEFASKK